MTELVYVLYEDQADLIHSKYNIIPVRSDYVSIFGHKKYRSIVQNNRARVEIYSKTAEPFSFCVKVDFEVVNEVITYELIQILEAYIFSKTGLKCSGSEIVKYENLMHIYPMINNEYIYMNDEESLLFDIDPSEFLGYGLISRHDIGIIALRKDISIPTYKVIYGLIVYDLALRNYIDNEEIKKRIRDVEFHIDNFIQNGKVAYFHSSFNNTDNSKLDSSKFAFTLEEKLEKTRESRIVKNELDISELVQSDYYSITTPTNSTTSSHINIISEMKASIITELTHVWEFKRHESPEVSIYSGEGSYLSYMMSCSFSKWMEDSVYRIMLDKPPIVSVTGNWINDLSYDSNTAKLLIYYCAILSMRRVAENNRYMALVEDELTVGLDLIVHLPVWGPDDLKEFRLHMNSYSKNLEGYFIHNIPINININNLVNINHNYHPVIVNDDKIITTNQTLLLEGSDVIKNSVVRPRIPYKDIKEVDGKYVVILDDYEEITIEGEDISYEEVKERWIRGDFVTRWGGYLLEKYDIVSGLLLK